MTGTRRAGDLVVHIVFARRLDHGQALDLLQGLRVVHDHRALHIPDAQQCVLAVLVELDVRGGLARHRLQGLDDLQGALVDDVHLVLVGAEEHVRPGVGRVFVTAHEEARPLGGDALDGLPGLHVDDADLALAQVGRRKHRSALVVPGDPRTEMRHASQIEFGDAPPQVEVHHLTLFAVARGADQQAVRLVEEEVVQIVVQVYAAHRERPALARHALVQAVVVHGTVVYRQRLVRIGDLPHLRDVLERRDEAVPRRGVVYRAHPRFLAAVAHRDDPDRFQIDRVQQHQAVRQIVGHHDVTPVSGDRQVAGVYAGADLGHVLQAPHIELADPAVARGEIHEPAVRRILGTAVQREVRLDAGQRFESVAVQDGGVVITQLDHHEHVHQVRLVHRPVRQVRGRDEDLVRRQHLRLAPHRRMRQGRVDEIHQGLDLRLVQAIGKRRHLARRAALPYRLCRLALLQARQVLRQQGRAHPAEPVLAVTLGAIGLEQRGSLSRLHRRIRRGGSRTHPQDQRHDDTQQGLHEPSASRR